MLKTPCGCWNDLSLDVSTNDSTTKGDTSNRHLCSLEDGSICIPSLFSLFIVIFSLHTYIEFHHMINPYLNWQALLSEQWEIADMIWSSTDCTRDTKNYCLSKWEIKWKIYESLKSLSNLSVMRLGSQFQPTSWLEKVTKCVSAIKEWACCPLNITVVLPITSNPIALPH